MTDFTFIRSRRRTIAIIIKPDGSITVRAPFGCSKKRAAEFVLEKQEWIERTLKKLAERRSKTNMDSASGTDGENGTDGESRTAGGAGSGGRCTVPSFTEAEINELKKAARKKITSLVVEAAERIGVDYGRISVRAQKSRWGSCSSKGNLNFNCLLMLLPENIQRYVVVHELCHRRQMNHSAAFWREVERYCPTYREDRKQLRTEGSALLARLH